MSATASKRKNGRVGWVLGGVIAAMVLGCRHDSHPAPSSEAGMAATRVTLRTSDGNVELELDPGRAPISVENFLTHIRRGDYDGTIFHRVVPGFVVQGGGWTPELVEKAKTAAAAGQPDVAIANEWRNGLKNVRGTIAMAREEGPDTATREFYINLADNVRLDTARAKTGNAGYAVFGKVSGGMGVIDRAALATTRKVDVPGVTDGSMENVPVTPVVIRSVWIRPASAQARSSRR